MNSRERVTHVPISQYLGIYHSLQDHRRALTKRNKEIANLKSRVKSQEEDIEILQEIVKHGYVVVHFWAYDCDGTYAEYDTHYETLEDTLASIQAFYRDAEGQQGYSVLKQPVMA